MMPPPSKRPRLDSLTSMRFVAAILVIVFHITSNTPFLETAPRLVRSVVDCGYVWVGFFFVLSGFILSYQYADRIPSTGAARREFLVARLARIYPGHLLALLLLVPLWMIKRWPGDLPPGGRRAAVATVLATLGLVHAWIPSFALTLNFPSW